MTKVTVCIPAYRSRWLAESIASVLGQSFRNLQVFVLDDGDGSAEEVCQRFSDPRLVYQRNPGNLGMVRNWNQCLVNGDGTYLALLHDDDVWEADFLRRMVGELEGSVASFAFSAATVIDGHGAPKRLHQPWRRPRDFDAGELHTILLKGNVILCPTVLLRRSALRGHFFDARFGYATDWRFWLALAQDSRVRYVPIPLARYREASDSVTGTLDSASGRDLRLKEAIDIIQDAGQGSTGRARRAMRSGLAKHLALLAINDAREGLASDHLKQARHTRPFSTWVAAATLYVAVHHAAAALGPSARRALSRLERSVRHR